MVVFRCTRPLAKRFGLRLEESDTTSTGVLGDWYATRLNVGSRRLVLCLSERSLLPVLMPARRNEFPDRFAKHLVLLLRFLDIPQALVEQEAREAHPPAFAPTRSKQILGSLNDFGRCARFLIRDSPNPCTPLEANRKLVEMPSKPLDYGFPAEAARALFDARACE
jgi:hypothetical protein